MSKVAQGPESCRQVMLGILVAPGLIWLSAWFVGLASVLVVWSVASATASRPPYSFMLLAGIAGLVLAVAAAAFGRWKPRLWRRAQRPVRAALLLGLAIAAMVAAFAVAALLLGADTGVPGGGFMWDGLGAFLVLVFGVALVAAVAAAVWLAVRLVNADEAHPVILGIRWPKRSALLRNGALAALAVAAPISLFTLLGFPVAIIIVFLQGISLVILLLRPNSSAAAFAVLTILILSIVSFNSLRGVATQITTPFHLLSVGSLLLLHRDPLRAHPARLRRLVRWGVALALTLVAVQVVLMAVNLPLAPSSIDELYPQRGFLFWRGSPLINFSYVGFNIPHGLFAAGLLALLPGTLPRNVDLAVAVLTAAMAAAMIFLLFGRGPYPVDPIVVPF